MAFGDQYSGTAIEGTTVYSVATPGSQISINGYLLPESAIVSDIKETLRKHITYPAGRKVGVTETWAEAGKEGNKAGRGELSFTIRGTLNEHPWLENEKGLPIEDATTMVVHKKFQEMKEAVLGDGGAVQIFGDVFSELGIDYVQILDIRSGQEFGFLNAWDFTIECKEELDPNGADASMIY